MRAALVVLFLTTLAGCGGSDVRNLPGSDRRAAESAAVVATGPIPVEIGPPPPVLAGPTAEEEIARLASRGASYVNARFVPATGVAPSETRLILRFDDLAGAPPAACGASLPFGASADATPRLLAVLCRNDLPISSASGTAASPERAAAERLVVDTVARLFPTDTDYGGYGASVGVGVGSGGDWGLGGGLSF